MAMTGFPNWEEFLGNLGISAGNWDHKMAD